MMDRRTLLCATAATAALAGSVAAAASLSGSIANPDAALIEAEQEIARLFDVMDAFPADVDLDDTIPEWNRRGELEVFIAEAEPVTLVGAAVKLRRLLDAEVGLATGDGV